MKHFNYSESQKKSVLTFALIAALGFSLSAPFQSSLSGNAEMASNTTETKKERIAIDGEVHEITITKQDSESVQVTYESSLEGKTCETGGCLSAAVLNAKFDDIAEITAALQNKLAEGKTTDIVEDIPDAATGRQKNSQMTKDKKAFDRLRGECKRDNNPAECLTNGLIRMLSPKKVDGEVALDFYNTDISRAIEDLGSAKDGDPSGFMAAADILRNLHAKLPSKYNAIRENAIATSLDMAKAARESAKSDAQRIQIDSTWLPYLQNKQTEGLTKAIQIGFLSQADALTLTQQLINGQQSILVSQNPVTGTIPTTITNLNDMVFQNRGSNTGRGAPIIGVILSTTRAFDPNSGGLTGLNGNTGPNLNTGFNTGLNATGFSNQNLPTSRAFVP